MDRSIPPQRVLIVDDAPETLRLLSRIIEAEGYQALQSPSGELALKIAARALPDLILLDVRMPGMDGYQTCQRLKETDPLKDIPVIFLSGLDEPVDKVRAFRAGGVDYLTKPFQEDELLARVRTHLRLRALSKHLEGEVRQRTGELEQEIIERKRIGDALQESEARLNLALDATNTGIWDFQPQTGEIYYSSQWFKMLGYEPGEYLHTYDTWLTLLHPEDRPRTEARVEEFFENRMEVYTAEFRMRAKDGQWRWIRAQGKAVAWDDDGNIKRVVGMHTDITERKLAQEALYKSTEKIRAMFESITDGITFTDLQGNIVELNEATVRMHGYTDKAELIGRSAMDLIAESDHARAMESLQETLLTGRSGVMEYKFLTKDGRVFDAELSAALLKDERGAPNGFVALTRDITGRKHAAAELATTQALLMAAIEQMPAGVLIADAPDVNIRIANAAALGIRGETTQSLTDIPASLHPVHWQVFYPDGRLCAPEDLPLSQAVLSGKVSQNVEFVIRRETGEDRWVSANAAPVRDTNGEIVAGVVVFLDITERKRAEEEYMQAQRERERLLLQIQEQAQRVQRIMDTVPEGVVLLDMDRHVVLANPLGKKELRFLAGVQVGETMTHLGNRPLSELLTSPPRGLWHDLEIEGRSFQVIARSMEACSTPGGWVMVIREVTRQREVQRQTHRQERLAAVGQLAAGIAHDFNNILGVITMYAQLTARSKELSDRERERLMTINQQAMQASTLIRQILDFSRASVFERSPLDLLPLLKEQVRLFEHTLPENISIVFDYIPPSSMPMGSDAYVVSADPTRIQQVMMNLVINARDAMRSGGELRIGLEHVAVVPGERSSLLPVNEGDWIQLTVADTGSGIPPDVLEHLFEPFFTTKAPGEGTGLGLAQVHGIVGAHDGVIDVETALGVGTTFTIYLPALVAAGPTLSDAGVTPLPMGDGDVILVVEDNDAMRGAVVAMLADLNYRTLVAANGHGALAVLADYADASHEDIPQIALVLSDMVMPEMGGVALFHAVREAYPEIKMILLTGHPTEGEVETLKALGLRAFLLKPPDVTDLAQTIAQVLRAES